MKTLREKSAVKTLSVDDLALIDFWIELLHDNSKTAEDASHLRTGRRRARFVVDTAQGCGHPDCGSAARESNPFNQAVIFAALGDKERALDAMERSIPAGPFRIGRQLAWPELAVIRDDPRMMAPRRRVGLPQVRP